MSDPSTGEAPSRRSRDRSQSQEPLTKPPTDTHIQTQDQPLVDPAESANLRSANETSNRPQNVIKRRPVHLPVNTGSTVTGTDSVLSTIIPSPLRIRRPKNHPRTESPAQMKSVRLLVASLGNPPPYATTRHSAGHIVLKNLIQNLHLPPLVKNKSLGNGLASGPALVGGSECVFWQSTSMMNVSGAGVLKAWKQFNVNQNDNDTVSGLVVLHDELESSTGTVKLRRGESSPKGHNGLKSVQSSLRSAGLSTVLGDKFIKIAIGIGRPESRERDDVSAWVLGQVTQVEKAKLDAAAESTIAVLQSEIDRLGRG